LELLGPLSNTGLAQCKGGKAPSYADYGNQKLKLCNVNRYFSRLCGPEKGEWARGENGVMQWKWGNCEDNAKGCQQILKAVVFLLF